MDNYYTELLNVCNRTLELRVQEKWNEVYRFKLEE